MYNYGLIQTSEVLHATFSPSVCKSRFVFLKVSGVDPINGILLFILPSSPSQLLSPVENFVQMSRNSVAFGE